MLLEGDAEGYVKLHDIVRTFGILLAAEEESHKFMVDDIQRWSNDEALNMYTAMSLWSESIQTPYFDIKRWAPKLREVEVVCCLDLQGFCPGNPVHNGVVELPFLEAVEIDMSRNFHSFSAAPSVARNLNRVKYNHSFCD